MKKMTFDIIVPVMGNLQLVRSCIESLYPLPINWNLHIYDSDLSAIDGTKEYLISKQKELNFNIIDDGMRSSHGDAVQKLIAATNSDWILHIDSDSRLLNKSFYRLVEKGIEVRPFKVWGRVDPTSPRPDIKNKPRVKLLRTYSWNILFERKFYIDNKLSFSPKKMEKNVKFEDGISESLFLWGDTSWELFWESSRQDLFGRYSDDVWKCWEHKGHGTVDWKIENQNAIINFPKKS